LHQLSSDLAGLDLRRVKRSTDAVNTTDVDWDGRVLLASPPLNSK